MISIEASVKARASCAEPDVEDEDPKALEELLGAGAREQACFAEGAHESLLPSFLGSAPAAKSKLRNVDDSWANHAEFQARCFEAAASFWSAKAKEEEAAASGEGYGLLVAYLDLADRHCVGALRVLQLGTTRSRLTQYELILNGQNIIFWKFLIRKMPTPGASKCHKQIGF